MLQEEITQENITIVDPQVQDDILDSVQNSTPNDAPASFDELDEIEGRHPEPKEAKNKENESDKEDKEKEPESEKDEDKDAETKDVEKPKPKGKIYKVQGKDGDLEIEEGAEFEVKIDGKQEKANLRQLLDNYSGTKHLQRELTKFRQEQKSFQDERDNVYSYMTELKDSLLEKKDFPGFVTAVAQVFGADPVEANTIAQEMLKGEIEKYVDLDPEQRAIKAQQEKLAYLERVQRQQTEARQAKIEQQRTVQEMESRARAVLEKTGMDEESFVRLYKELEKTTPLEELTPERVGEAFVAETQTEQEKKLTDDLTQMLSEVNKGLDEATQSKAIEELKTIQKQNPELGLKQLQEIAVEVYGSKAAKNLSRKVKKARANPVSTAKPEGVDPSDLFSFDDL